MCFLHRPVLLHWEGDFQQRKGAGTSTKLTAPEFDLPVFARQCFTQVQPPTPSVPTSEVFQSFPPCWDSPVTSMGQTLPSGRGSNTVPLLCANTYSCEICTNLTAWRLLSHLVEIGQAVQKLLGGGGGERLTDSRIA